MAPREDVAGRTGQALRPPDGGSVKDDVLFWPREKRGGPVGGSGSAAPDGALSHHLEAGLVRRRTVMLPAHKAGDGISLLHAGTLENPKPGFCASPVATAVERHDTPGSDDVTLVRATPPPVFGEDINGLDDLIISQAAVNAVACDDAPGFAEGADSKD